MEMPLEGRLKTKIWPSLADLTVFLGSPQKPELGGKASSRLLGPKEQLANTYL
jgi:hypothetical protein